MKKILPLLTLILMLMPLTAQAQEGPTEGAACATAGVMSRAGGPEITSPNGGNWLICNGANWVMAWNYGRNARSQMQFDYDAGACTAVKTGRIRYHSALNNWSYCNGSNWAQFTRTGDSCNFWGQAPGYVCPDGTVFAGFLPDAESTPLYTTRCDAGQTWNGSVCTGTRTTLAWGDSGQLRNTADLLRGDLNTYTLNGNHELTWTHPAADYCATLNMHGRSDWYLPALGELTMMNTNKAAISGLSVTYQTSTEWDSTHAVLMETSSNGNYHAIKSAAWNVRCVRRNL